MNFWQTVTTYFDKYAKIMMIEFWQAVKICFRKYATFSGRAQRSEFWWWYLFIILGTLIFGILDAGLASIIRPEEEPVLFRGREVAEEPVTLFRMIFFVNILLPHIAVTARRLHDIDKSGWWQCLALMIFPIITLIIWWAAKGTEGDNRFGADPLKINSEEMT